MLVEKVKELPDISIHAPPRGATDDDVVAHYTSVNFNSRPSARGDMHIWRIFHICSNISIHAPPRGATRHQRHVSRINRFQFTPLREGRRIAAVPAVPVRFISIHAPPRGATTTAYTFAPDSIFQFTPLREGRRAKPMPTRLPRIYFNSRPSARGDQSSQGVRVCGRISIHAPPRGATLQRSIS